MYDKAVTRAIKQTSARLSQDEAPASGAAVRLSEPAWSFLPDMHGSALVAD